MSRRKSAIKRPVLADSRYDSQTVSKFINAMMYQGKKSTAERIFYGAMDLVESRTNQPGVNVFKQRLKRTTRITMQRNNGAMECADVLQVGVDLNDLTVSCQRAMMRGPLVHAGANDEQHVAPAVKGRQRDALAQSAARAKPQRMIGA